MRPIRHTFQPDPLHPNQCALCGNRAEKHQPPTPDTLVGWQRSLGRA